jgi:hypothetical protein
MNLALKRSYRKKLTTTGLIYLHGEEREVSVSNISMTGVLVDLNVTTKINSELANSIIAHSIIDFYLPKLRLAGTAEIIRVTEEDSQIILALKFREITYNIDGLLYKRKVYRKNMSVRGWILLSNEYYDFQTVNVSVEGLMIRLAETVVIAEGMVTSFEFKDVNLKGEVLVVWIDFDSEGRTLVGLKYVHLNVDTIKGIPRFAPENGDNC